MAAFYGIFVVGIVVVLFGGGLVLTKSPSELGPVRGSLVRLRAVRAVAIEQLGRYGAALGALLAFGAIAILIPWPFGRFARRFRKHLDGRFLGWTLKHAPKHGFWHHANAEFTKVGNRLEIKIVCIVVAVVFAALWARRGFWIPILTMLFGFFFEKGGQMLLKAVVDRPDVTDLPNFGQFPSGGCARALVTYGLLVELIILTWPSISRTARVGLWTLLGLVVFWEGYTRVILIKHWGMDVIAGWLYGTLMLLALIAGLRCLVADRTASSDTSPDAAIASAAA